MSTLTADVVELAGVRFPSIWLRDNCPCADCRDPGTAQKLFGITDLPETILVADVEESTDQIAVTFAADGHRTVFAREWLLANPPDGSGLVDARSEHGKELWSASDLAGRFPRAQWSRYVDDPTVTAPSLEAVVRLGFVVLEGVPVELGMVLRVVETFGFVRETNYGNLFDVRVKANPNNLAFTGLTITPHTDNPYRDPVPTLQLLHCLSNAAEGGESGLVDGFKVASRLRRTDPDSFDILTRTPVPFAFRDSEAELRTNQPIISVDARGNVRGIRFSNRHVQPLRLTVEEMIGFYRAYRRFAEIAYAPELQINFKLSPGECVIFDNTRVLHARTAFSSTGERHLQGAYADLDSLESTLAVLRRG